jgi:hypothetical protein
MVVVKVRGQMILLKKALEVKLENELIKKELKYLT